MRQDIFAIKKSSWLRLNKNRVSLVFYFYFIFIKDLYRNLKLNLPFKSKNDINSRKTNVHADILIIHSWSPVRKTKMNFIYADMSGFDRRKKMRKLNIDSRINSDEVTG